MKFDQMYHNLTKYEMVLPEGVRAFFLLNAANLTVDVEKLARATVGELNYKNMKDIVMKICGDPIGSEDSGGAPPVKEEVLFGYGRSGSRRNFQQENRGNRGGYHGGFRGGYRGVRGSSPSNAGGSGGYHSGNPIGADGKVLRCHECESTKHFVERCPYRRDNSKEIHITLFNAVPNEKQKNLLLESLGKGLLDSGCSKTVAGVVWIEELLNTLPEDERSKVSEQESHSTFRFGDGVEVKAIKQLKVPLEIAGSKIVMTIDMVKNEIPLLISKGAMKQMEMQIDFRNDTVTAMGKMIKLESTSSGHYVIPVTAISNESSKVVLHLQNIPDLSKQQKTTKALKLHRQFSHAPANKLLKLVDNSSINDKEFRDCVKEVCDACSFCRAYKPAPLKPAVGLPLASHFNDVVCMDLVEFEQKTKSGFSI